MRVSDLFEGRRPYYAEHSANEAVLKSTGQRFYSGAFDPLDGHILEIHSWEEAVDADHHHSLYFTPRMVQKMSEERANFFWFSRFQLHTMWRQGEAPPAIRRAILAQVDLSPIRAEVPGMNHDMVHVPENGPDQPLNLYLPRGKDVVPVKGYFRDDDSIWGWVALDNKDQEIKPIGWSK